MSFIQSLLRKINRELKIHIDGCWYNERLIRILSSGSSGHTRVTRPGQTHKKPEDLSVCKREDRVCGEVGGGEGVCM